MDLDKRLMEEKYFINLSKNLDIHLQLHNQLSKIGNNKEMKI
jgi:hypothetical protein